MAVFFFLRYEFGGFYLQGLIHGGAYFRNFTVFFYIPEVNLARGKETLKFSGPYSKIRPAKLTNLSARTN